MEWKAKWITGPAALDNDKLVSPYVFKKQINVTADIQAAKVYVSALGFYTLYLDGTKVGNRYLTPGHTEYTERVQYQEYDLPELKGKKECMLTAFLADGWYAGKIGLCVRPNMWGKKRALLCEIHLLLSDGSEEIIASDETWQVSEDGPYLHADIYDGVIYDARKESVDTMNFEPAAIYRAKLRKSKKEAHTETTDASNGIFEGKLPKSVIPDCGEPVLVHDVIPPVRILPGKDGDTLIDFGRNMGGLIQIGPFEGKAGQHIVIRHGELIQDGRLYTDNLRTAKQTVEYIAKDGMQTFIPEFTYMGFQYVSVTGLDVTENTICARDLYSDMEQTGTFACSNELLNKFQRNVLTSLKANFIDFPTDSPQRDERCGWTGDIALFAPCAAFNMDISRFMKKWLGDLVLVQNRIGTGVVPVIVPSNNFVKFSRCNEWAEIYRQDDAVWGDAAVLVPWAVYQSNGDKSILRDQYKSMKKWVEYEHKQAENSPQRLIWNTGMQLGDWLAPGEGVDQWRSKAKWTSTAYFANSANLLSKAAGILGIDDDERTYHDLYEDVRKAFQDVLVGEDGHITDGFQSIYVLALKFGLLTPEQEKLALDDLVKDVKAHNNHLATGFVGTDKLMFALSDFGRSDVAYDLLLQKTFPSLLYPVTCGATSTWERWDSLKPDGTINTVNDGTVNMVSFNHYAYGASALWLYTRMGGLEAIEPGYKTFRLSPVIGGDITWAEVSKKTTYGEIRNRWEKSGDTVTMTFTVPEGTSASVEIPGEDAGTYGPGKYTVSWKAN